MRRMILLALVGCGGVDSDPGATALVRVSGAQFYPGAMPAATTDVRVTAIESLNNTIWAGQVNKALGGRLAGAGLAVAIGFPDDTGYWIVPAGAADLNTPDELTWSAKASFSDALSAGRHDLEVAAVDANGRLGPPNALTLTVNARQLDLTDAKLAFALHWDTEADLDLHVVLPGEPAVIVWSGNLNSYIPPAPGDPVDPAAAAAGGILDFDSNSQCVIDGRREENVVWRGATAAPAHGTYTVLVDAFSLCAATTAHWSIDVYRDADATSLAHAEGTAGDADTRFDHIASSGVRALTFDY
ncbi:MAG: hypothetical protein JWO36_3655 [Myxococcales bacterium]|nr:hypothetical protein [Myxococcales bacterium]